MNNNLQIINHLKKDLTEIEVYTQEVSEGYKQKKLVFRYLTKGSLLEKNFKEGSSQKKNHFWYIASEEVIDELAKQDPLEIFDFLVQKHLKKNQGFGKVPKAFQTPCPLCKQKTLTTLGWSEAGYPDNLERFFCRLCRTSFGWIEIKEDPLELQTVMKGYYIVFKEVEIKQDTQLLKHLSKQLEAITTRLEKNYQFIHLEQRTPI